MRPSYAAVSRYSRQTSVSLPGILLLVGAITAIVLVQRTRFQTTLIAGETRHEKEGGASFPSTNESALTRWRATELIQNALADRQVVVRIVLGDVATADVSAEDRSQAYFRLVNNSALDLTFCRFPGDAQGRRQACIAQLNRAARQYVAKSNATPIKTIVPEHDGPPAPNRESVDLVVARPIPKEINTMLASSSSAQDARYTALYAMTPIATALQLKIEDFPSLRTFLLGTR